MLTSCGDDDGNNEPVDSQHTSHDNWDNGLHDQLWPHDSHGGNAHPGLGCAVGCSEAWRGTTTYLQVQTVGSKMSKQLRNALLDSVHLKAISDELLNAVIVGCFLVRAEITAEVGEVSLQANTSAEAAPMNPKKGPTTSPFCKEQRISAVLTRMPKDPLP